MLEDKKKYLGAVAVILLLVVFGVGVKYGMHKSREASEEWRIEALTDADMQNETGAQEIYIQVYVTGSVQNRGVFKLNEGARVYEAVELARPQENAALDYVDMARVLEDGETIVIIDIDDMDINDTMTANIPRGGLQADGKVNINTALEGELAEKLPGIGPVLAQKIVEYRMQMGRFNSIEDIQNVSGIGEKRFADIKDKIKVR